MLFFLLTSIVFIISIAVILLNLVIIHIVDATITAVVTFVVGCAVLYMYIG